MAHSLSAKKRIRQNETRRARNRSRKKDLRGVIRTATETIEQGDAAKAREALRAAMKKIDKTAAQGTLHKNTAARRKSRLQRQLNAMSRGRAS